MSKEEIKEYLKRVDALELKLTGEDKDTYQWLLFGYNECARLLNEKEQENSQLKEDIKGFEQERQTLYNTIHDLQKANKQLNRKIENAIEYYEIIDNRNTYVEISELRHLINLLKGDKE